MADISADEVLSLTRRALAGVRPAATAQSIPAPARGRRPT
jgi:hypothetical protein